MHFVFFRQLPYMKKNDKIKNMEDLLKNQIYTVKIDGYSSEAYGVCRIGGRVVFVPRALAGEIADPREFLEGSDA